MNNYMYFLALIADALQQPNPKNVLAEALSKIIQLGKDPRYEQVFLQFQHFMIEVSKNWEIYFSKPDDIYYDNLQDLAFQLATDIFQGDQDETQNILDQIRSHPPLWNEYDELCSEAKPARFAHQQMNIIVEYEGEHFYSLPIQITPITKMISGALPGRYIIRFNTGRILWQGELKEHDLLWGKAFPARELELAAETEERTAIVTREIKLLDGEMIIRIIPKIESGCIEFTIRQ
ncbi:MAG: hypothetical protein HF978_06350 [Desulfobacteraceae bacterium]|nr:hypothetical protein [Desulfobacteraceae bacterium]MBC2755151.1 hypothetical protein [Desulfobacteraceae bacterium]